MSRLLILGNSHAATLRLAQDEIAQAYPDYEISFYGLPALAYDRAQKDKHGLFGPAKGDSFGAKKAREWNSDRRIDLAPYDRIFVVGHRWRMYYLARLLYVRYVYGMQRVRQKAGISESFLLAAMAAWVRDGTDEIIAKFGADPRMIFAPSPYPLARASLKRAEWEPAFGLSSRLADSQMILDVYEGMIADEMEARGLHFVLQPRETLDRAFLTKDAYARVPEEELGKEGVKDDHRHTNAAYAKILFAAMHEAAQQAPIDKQSNAPHPEQVQQSKASH
ncbi:MAG: hypothetical protein ACRBBK_11315 [Paracoccaceae bacterium]